MAAINEFPQTNGVAAPPATAQTTVPPPAKDMNKSSIVVSEIPTTAPAADDIPLFSPSLISPSVLSLLPENYTIRPLRRSDYHNGYLDVLRVLTSVGDVSYEEWSARYDWMARRNDEYFLLVVCDGENRIVGTGSLIVERKFIHSLGLVGHIEDIAVAKDQQGLKLGLRIIQSLDTVAAQVGCYKSILDCSEANEGFYLKCGFKRAGLEMARYYD